MEIKPIAGEELLHKPVLVREAVKLLVVDPNGTYFDGTLGAGGHSSEILKQLGADGRLVGIDRDAEILSAAGRRLSAWKTQCEFVQGNFAMLGEIAAVLEICAADGVLLDLGMSSFQLDDAGRGFSFMQEGPLDMRMDRRQKLTAEALVRETGERELADLIRTLGEERFARRIAMEMIRDRVGRERLTTGWLADLVCRVKGGRRGGIHPATQVFQALRIAVNAEMENLENGLDQGIRLLKPGGRMVVISYHSLEDRRVKMTFTEHVGRLESQHGGGRRRIGALPAVAWLVKKPLMASDDEILENYRARSAKLRAIERID